MESAESQTSSIFALAWYPSEGKDDLRFLAHEVVGNAGEWLSVEWWDLELIASESIWLDPVGRAGDQILVPRSTLLFNCEEAALYMINCVEDFDSDKAGKIEILLVREEEVH